jgi:dihydrofolate reductase
MWCRRAREAIWRNTTINRDNVVDAVRKLTASTGKTILTDGSHQLVHTLLEHDLVDGLHVLLYPIILGSGKRLFPQGVHRTFKLNKATPYPSGVVSLDDVRDRPTA